MTEEQIRLNAFIVTTRLQLKALRDSMQPDQLEKYKSIVKDEKDGFIDQFLLASQTSAEERPHFLETVDLLISKSLLE